ncbi:MAG: hypothetical protein JXQ75_22575 [Phycisphaerae bacterium]|nr:hypothetical protein [Phycisphaerae bacterium]
MSIPRESVQPPAANPICSALPRAVKASLLLALIALVGGGASLLAAVLAGTAWLLGVLAAALLGMAAAVLGFSGLRRIRRSVGFVKGRRVGRAAVLLGAASAVVHGTLLIAILLTINGSIAAAPVVAGFVAAAWERDVTGARRYLSKIANAALSQRPQILMPSAHMKLNGVGPVTGWSAGPSLIGPTWGLTKNRKVACALGAHPSRPYHKGPSLTAWDLLEPAPWDFLDPAPGTCGSIAPEELNAWREWSCVPVTVIAQLSSPDVPRPVWIETSGGRVFAYAFVNREALADGQVLLDDLLIDMPGGCAVLLRPDGPAHRFAAQLGWPFTIRYNPH